MRELTTILSAWEINFDSIGFDTDSDTEFGVCDITGERGDVINCTALDHNGNVVEFQALTSLVTGPLGKLAGAF